MVNHCGFVADIVFSCGRMADVVCGRTDTVSRHYLITYCTCTCRKVEVTNHRCRCVINELVD